MKQKPRLLIIDPSLTAIERFLNHPKAKQFEIDSATTGPLALKKVKEFEPDLVIIDLMIPHIHGIEVIKTLKENERTRFIGIIVSTYHVMIQNYHAAIELGANYFLAKPFSMDTLFALIENYFAGTLKPDPFSLTSSHQLEHDYCYHPIPSSLTRYMRFWGTRGSNPVSGPEYSRYGGNTSCLEIRYDNDLVIIDAGTGIRGLGDMIDIGDNETVHLFISHTHWDHITGFPFFAPLYKKNCHIIVWAPIGFEKSTKELFTSMFAYAYFPVRLDEMKAQVTFKELRDNQAVSIGNIVIDAHYVNHPGPTVGFKIQTPNKTVGYVTDNEVLLGYLGHPNEIRKDNPLLEPHLSLIKFLTDCQLIIHEAQYFPKEYHKKIGWGHSSIPNATVLIKYCRCKYWLATHHDPNHSDKDLHIKLQLHKDIIKECNLDTEIDLAYDGMILPI